MCLAAGLRPDPPGSYSTLPDPLTVIRGGDGRAGEERVWNCREGRKGREEKDAKG